MKKILLALVLCLLACGCSTTRQHLGNPKGAIPYLLNGLDAQYASQHKDQSRGIILVEWNF